MKAYMIERRYGPGNRDMLAAYGPGDQSTTWVLGPNRAEIYSCLSTAQNMLNNVRLAAEKWDNANNFTFAVIEDRRHLPPYFASTTVD